MQKIQIPPELEKRFVTLAERYKNSEKYWGEFLYFFETFLEDVEDYLTALERSEDVESGKEKTIPFEEVVKKLGLEKEV